MKNTQHDSYLELRHHMNAISTHTFKARILYCVLTLWSTDPRMQLLSLILTQCMIIVLLLCFISSHCVYWIYYFYHHSLCHSILFIIFNWCFIITFCLIMMFYSFFLTFYYCILCIWLIKIYHIFIIIILAIASSMLLCGLNHLFYSWFPS